MNACVKSVHEKKKPFKCDICNFSCYQKRDLKKHIESAHENKKLFRCDICDKTFNQKTNMTAHISRGHQGMNP